MTPEEFLAHQDLLRGVVGIMQPVYELLAVLRKGFIEQAGLGPEAADQLVVQFSAIHLFKTEPSA